MYEQESKRKTEMELQEICFYPQLQQVAAYERVNDEQNRQREKVVNEIYFLELPMPRF